MGECMSQTAYDGSSKQYAFLMSPASTPTQTRGTPQVGGDAGGLIKKAPDIAAREMPAEKTGHGGMGMEAHLSGFLGGAATLGQHGHKGSSNFVARVLNTTVQDVADRGLCALALLGHLHLSDPRCL